MTHPDHDRHDDVHLVTRAQTGDPDAFGVLYARYFATVRAVVYARMRGPNRRNADDLVSDVFAKAWASIDRFTWKGRAFPAWLTQIAINTVRDHYAAAETSRTEPRETSAHTELVGDFGDFAQAFIRAEDAARVRGALSFLTENQRACVVDRYYLGLRVDEIAARQGLATTAVKALLHRAYRRLRTRLAEDPRQE